jgi:glycosyltransferase involved in cell wall biosynthesis
MDTFHRQTSVFVISFQFIQHQIRIPLDNHQQEQTRLRVSVVIPVFNGGPDLEKCLLALKQSDYPLHECLLVDDASTDGMVNPAAEAIGARVIRLERQSGPAKARNLGVEEANGDIIFFTDADVILHPQAIGEAVKALESDADLAAVFGSYDDQPGHLSFLSQYRNLFHHWVHQTGSAEASTFWTGCGAIRRDVFLQINGFSQDYDRPSIEDIEMGSRLRRSGHRIRLLKNMLGKHMKDWRFWNMVRTDIFSRGVPWMQLVLKEGKVSGDLNLNYKSRIATLLAGLLGLSVLLLLVSGHALAVLPALVFLLLASACSRLSMLDKSGNTKVRLTVFLTGLLPLACYALVADPWALIPLLLTAAIVATHLAFYRYVAEKRNSAFATAVIPMQVVFFAGCALAIPIAFFKHHLTTRSKPAE